MDVLHNHYPAVSGARYINIHDSNSENVTNICGITVVIPQKKNNYVVFCDVHDVVLMGIQHSVLKPFCSEIFVHFPTTIVLIHLSPPFLGWRVNKCWTK